MKDKFSYFDFICYFIPGYLLLWALIWFSKDIGFPNSLKTINIFTDTLGFLVLVFILGHFIQFRAKYGFETNLKNKYWNGAFVSEQYLIKDNNFCLESERQRFLEMASGMFEYDMNELEDLERNSERSKRISHSVYRKAYALINNEEFSEKSAVSITYYHFFRGLSVACFYCAILFSIKLTLIFTEYCFVLSWNNIKVNMLVPMILIILFLYLKRCFKFRAKERGEFHVEQVYNYAYVIYSKRKKIQIDSNYHV